MPSTKSRSNPIVRRLAPILLFFGAFALYAATAAPGTLFGDPSEYQFIPAVLGIAHPPGYAFYTLLAKLWQMLVPVGTVAFRTNLLAGAAGAWAATAAYLIVRDLSQTTGGDTTTRIVAPLFAALSLAAAPDLWQHAIHANAHIVSAALALTHLWMLLRWWRSEEVRWLAAFAVTLGLAAAHHPITMMGVPAYGLFILATHISSGRKRSDTQILRQWRTLLLLIGCLLLGLTPFLYYPLRSPTAPFGPQANWESLWRHVTAQGLRVNLFPFGLVDQPDRALVFWSLLRLQFPLPTIALILIGLVELWRRAPKPAILMYIFLVTHLLFTLNTEQDVMAYLLLPFAALAVTAGVGAQAFVALIARVARRTPRETPRLRWGQVRNALLPLSALVLLIWPVLRGAQNLNRGISLRDFTAAEEWVDAVHRRFDGRGEGAILLCDWEHYTPLIVHAYTQKETLDKADVEAIYASTAMSWPEWVWSYIDEGPVYLSDDRAAVRNAGLRLVPEGHFYRVVPPPVEEATPSHALDVWAGERVHILGHDLPKTTVRAGEPLPLTLYQSAPQPMDEIWMPYARLGPVEARWTIDSRLLTTQWLTDEVAVERYEIPVPFNLPPGEYPLRLGYASLTGGQAELPLSSGEATVELAAIEVEPTPQAPSTEILEKALANLDNQVALMKATVRSRWRAYQAPWDKPPSVKAGDSFRLILRWRALASPREGTKVFVHLLDHTGSLVLGKDAEPLGRSCPTYLWFPKWLPGQTFTDPYRLEIPSTLPPGDYAIEVGMYGATSLRRLPVVDLEGNLIDDRVIIGSLRVE